MARWMTVAHPSDLVVPAVVASPPPLTAMLPVVQRFVLHWGEMGTRWGLNRTVAQVHALLYLAERPLNADDITGHLAVARSNVSTSLKELVGWDLIRTVHLLGDRRDHFETLHDPWELFRRVLAERRRRELDPTTAELAACAAQAEADGAPAAVRERIVRMQGFFEAMGAAHDAVKDVPPLVLAKTMSAGAMLRRLFGS
jgi:DNA-binding transcriptional regulator GbsR (MarR family)